SVIDRFRQITPRVMFAIDGYRYGGKAFDRRDVLAELFEQLPSLEAVVFLPYLDPDANLQPPRSLKVVAWRDAVADPRPPEYETLAFEHPLRIVYSSGTTGMPKAIAHGHGGALLMGRREARESGGEGQRTLA